MIDNYLLEYLVTFAKYQTLAKTATALNVTQPTVTRGLRKLEELLDVKLFDRTPNRITLTETGELAATEAAQLLRAQHEFITKIQGHAKNQQRIKVVTTAPGPHFILEQFSAKELSFSPELLLTSKIKTTLENNQANLVIAEKEIHTPELESLYLGYEELYANLDNFTYQANQQTVTFNDLAQMSFVVLGEIGPWKDLIQKNIPTAKFLFQQEYDALKEITSYSNFPYFSTNVTQTFASRNTKGHTRLRIAEPAAKLDFYGIYRKENRALVAPTLKKLAQIWPK